MQMELPFAASLLPLTPSVPEEGPGEHQLLNAHGKCVGAGVNANLDVEGSPNEAH